MFNEAILTYFIDYGDSAPDWIDRSRSVVFEVDKKESDIINEFFGTIFHAWDQTPTNPLDVLLALDELQQRVALKGLCLEKIGKLKE